MDKETYLTEIAATRPYRMRWWQEARFGMFVHWGLYSQLGRHEWVMNRERIPVAEYEPLADTWKPKERPAREWAALAKQAGMKYMVMTTKHHEGFCLWDTQMTDYNAVKRGPGRDLVREYVEACREFGLKIGFYYSLMDWHHPDGALCATDEAARRRFLDYTQGLVRELMTNYGRIDILWYDVSWPLSSPEPWESVKMTQMARDLQPHIIVDNRDQLDEDFGTPEEHITAEAEGRNWEACMTFNGSWGYMPSAPDSDWHTSRAILGMLSTVTAGQGNLLLNIGPAPDGSVPPQAYERLLPVGNWLECNGEAVYGKVDRADGKLEWMPLSGNPMGRSWTLKGNTGYFWVARWPGSTITIGGLKTKLLKASILATGQQVEFTQEPDRVIFRGLPEQNPDEFCNTSILKLEFDGEPRQELGAGCVVL
jgi:alpha-L-fucosidase